LATRHKDSSELMNLRKIEENLAKQEDYLEAHKVQKQIEILERTEFEKWNFNRLNKIRNLLQQLRNKQETELSAIRQKIEQGFEEQKKIRNQEYEK
jgi:biopolymer transport protein ExbB/TolQ